MRNDAIHVREASASYSGGREVPVVSRGFKQTEIGMIPEDWECVAVVEVARLESGHTPSRTRSAYWNGSVPWVSLHDTESLGEATITATAQTITEDGLANSSARLLPEGTVIFSRTATVGKCTTLSRPMATSQDFANYICGPRLHNHYLVYLFRSMSSVWQRLMAGSIHNTIYMPVFKTLKIPLPPKQEQRAIAEALSEVDGLLGALEALIAKKRAIKQAAMQQLLTGKTRLPGFSGDWTPGIVGDVVASLVAGVSVNSVDAPVAAGVPSVLKTSALVGGVFLPGEAKVIEARDIHRARTNPERDTILVSRMNTPNLVGELAYVDRDYDSLFLPDRIWMARFSPRSKLSVRWLAYVLSSPSYRDLLREVATGTSGSMKNISKSALLAIPVKYPDYDEQVAIAQSLSDMDSDIAALERRRDKTRAIKQGMMQQLLTGRVRLIQTTGDADA